MIFNYESNCITVKSIPDTLVPNNTLAPDYEPVLISEVHYYCIGTDTTPPHYRGVLILECHQ